MKNVIPEARKEEVRRMVEEWRASEILGSIILCVGEQEWPAREWLQAGGE